MTRPDLLARLRTMHNSLSARDRLTHEQHEVLLEVEAALRGQTAVPGDLEGALQVAGAQMVATKPGLTAEAVRELLEGIPATAELVDLTDSALEGLYLMDYSVDALGPVKIAVLPEYEDGSAPGWKLLTHSLSLARLVLAQAEELERLRERVGAVEQVAIKLHFYSRRYCDGRSTYAPSEHNMNTHTLLVLGIELHRDPISKTGPFALDGMYGLRQQEKDMLTALEGGAL
ncbi:hypothetical protein [Deinococcus hopiensis]|uniref:Uncharacterized protein n=1 Tax=Deinococcus hopiensis KR-140 TaxID=695939 RepID=A0A1W1VJ54_9DEIO|nr:hypothetical protein [Deinococcus hopiensis]SMB93358.1 hypothetical protein SAMN00790413_01951 [Deinococcus hopiensis KR-140]